MKIAYFVHCFPPAKGGLEFLSGEIVKILREAGHEVHVFTGKGQTLDSYKTFSNWVDESDDDEYIHRLPLNFFWQRLTNKFLYHFVVKFGVLSPWYFGPLLKFSEREEHIIKKCDLIFGAGMPTMMFYKAYTYAKRFNKRLILHPSYHDVRYYNNVPFFQKAISYANKVILQTPLEEKLFCKKYKISKKNISFLAFSSYSETDINMAEKNISTKMKQIKKHFKAGMITLGHVGQISKRKNLDYFKHLLNNTKKIDQIETKYSLNLTFAGVKTNDSSEIINEMETWTRYKTKLIFNFSNKQKADIYKSLDFLLNPSFEESLGIVNFEGIYHNCLTFVHKKSAFYSLIAQDSSVATASTLLLPSDLNKLINLAKSSALLHNRLLFQIKILKKYSKDKYSERLLEIIEGKYVK